METLSILREPTKSRTWKRIPRADAVIFRFSSSFCTNHHKSLHTYICFNTSMSTSANVSVKSSYSEKMSIWKYNAVSIGIRIPTIFMNKAYLSHIAYIHMLVYKRNSASWNSSRLHKRISCWNQASMPTAPTPPESLGNVDVSADFEARRAPSSAVHQRHATCTHRNVKPAIPSTQYETSPWSFTMRSFYA